MNVTELLNSDGTCIHLFIINLLKLSKLTTFVLGHIIQFTFIINWLNVFLYLVFGLSN